MSLLEVSILMFAIGATVMIGFATHNIRQTTLSTTTATVTQAAILQSANSLLLNFAEKNGRLPCVDVDGDGREDCKNTTQKGWLPYRTIGLFASDVEKGQDTLRYLVQRSTPVDLTLASDVWQPAKFKSDPTTGPAYVHNVSRGYSQPNIGTPDLCHKLIANVGAKSSIFSNSKPPRSVVYAIAHSGARDADGDGNLFDGINGDATNGMEPSDRQSQSGKYDDRVLESTSDTMQRALGCDRLLQSIDSVGLSTDFFNDLTAQKTPTTQAIAMGVSGSRGLFNTYRIAQAIDGVRVSAETFALALIQLTAALGLEGATAGISTVALIDAIVDMALATISVVLSLDAILINIASVLTSISAVIVMAFAISHWNISTDVKGYDPTNEMVILEKTAAENKAQTAKLKTARDDGINQQNKLSQFSAEQLSKLRAIGNATVNEANKASKGSLNIATDIFDGGINATLSDARLWWNADQNYRFADAAYKKATTAEAARSSASESWGTLFGLTQAAIALEADPDKKANMLQANVELERQAASGGSVDEQIAQITQRIDALNGEIRSDPENSAESVRTRDALQTMLATIVPSTQAALIERQEKDNIRIQALATFRRSFSAVVDSAKIPYSYKKCADSSCVVETAYYDGRQAVEGALKNLFLGAFETIGGNLGQGAYFQMLTANANVEVLQNDYAASLDRDAKLALNLSSLKSIKEGQSVPAGDLPVWTGANEILRRVDQRGSAL